MPFDIPGVRRGTQRHVGPSGAERMAARLRSQCDTIARQEQALMWLV
jgi:hypothetical protein